MSEPRDDEDDDRCEALGHDDYVREENDDLRIFGCHRCGAEWWEDDDA